MVGDERDDVEMDIEEVMGLIGSKREQQGLSTSALPPPADVHTGQIPAGNENVPLISNSGAHEGGVEGLKNVKAALLSKEGGDALLSSILDDDMYDPLAGEEASPVLLVSVDMKKQLEGRDAAAPNGAVTGRTSSFEFESSSDRMGETICTPAECRVDAKAEGHEDERTGDQETGGAPRKVMALAGLLEQYEDEESEPDEEGEVSAGEQSSERVAADDQKQGVFNGERGGIGIVEKSGLDLRQGEPGQQRQEHSAKNGNEEGAKPRDKRPTGFSERRDEAHRDTERRPGQGGQENAQHGNRHASREAVSRDVDQTRPGRSRLDDDMHKLPDNHRRERESFRGSRPGGPSQHRQDRSDWDRGRDRRDRERPPDRRPESGSGRNRESDDRRKDNVPFRRAQRDARERGGPQELGRKGPHDDKHREGGRRDSKQRHDGPRDRRHERSPPFEDRRKPPDTSKARASETKAESKPAPKPDPKPDSKAGSTGADVDLSAAVAAAAAAAAKSAKLAASRAPPPLPADPVEAAAKAAEMVNKTLMIQNAVLQQKRKMLWGDKKTTPEEATTGGTNRWDAAAVGDSERTHKFQKLMGLKAAAPLSPPKAGEVPAVMTAEKQQQMQAELERQYAAGLRRRDGRTVGLGL